MTSYMGVGRWRRGCFKALIDIFWVEALFQGEVLAMVCYFSDFTGFHKYLLICFALILLYAYILH
jgi:hypothetical protein